MIWKQRFRRIIPGPSEGRIDLNVNKKREHGTPDSDESNDMTTVVGLLFRGAMFHSYWDM
ncbi:uncharacterized protein RCO7_14827 [Rhynchosporium graminicola]|uniref:Uncharacterized protein n=1 Tax=Rhynchosporium graminicola TaxID=2792576 RepID=A0A1E1L4V9_9HELO|nr:uncharacterized protein RCO7_14827 [Rhynchosporium commune]